MSEDKLVAGISVVCVFNDPDVRQESLDRSIEAYRGGVNVDYIRLDNTRHHFTSAGAALNHGASRAKHNVIVFVHQDVYLHSIDRIAAVGVHLNGERWGVLGANGVPRSGPFVGRMRDRVQVIGCNADSPQDVDSLDEVLFMVSRERVFAHPLSEEPDLAWHAYAVEYGLRMRQLGLGVGAVNLAITHNSMSVNLDGLSVAHRRVADLHPEQLPVQTTCGQIGVHHRSWRDAPVIRDHRWRLGWLTRSFRAFSARRILHLPVIFSEIRTDVDLLAFSVGVPLNVINLDGPGGFAKYASEQIRLSRAGSPVVFWAVPTVDDLLATIDSLPQNESMLVADLDTRDLPLFVGRLPDESDWLLGLQEGATWLLGGPAVRDLPPEWFKPQAVPLGGERWVRTLRSPV